MNKYQALVLSLNPIKTIKYNQMIAWTLQNVKRFNPIKLWPSYKELVLTL